MKIDIDSFGGFIGNYCGLNSDIKLFNAIGNGWGGLIGKLNKIDTKKIINITDNYINQYSLVDLKR